MDGSSCKFTQERWMLAETACLEGHQEPCSECRQPTQHSCAECGKALHKQCAAVFPAGAHWDEEGARLVCHGACAASAQRTFLQTAGTGGGASAPCQGLHARGSTVRAAPTAGSMLSGDGDLLRFPDLGGAASATHCAPLFRKTPRQTQERISTPEGAPSAPAAARWGDGYSCSLPDYHVDDEGVVERGSAPVAVSGQASQGFFAKRAVRPPNKDPYSQSAADHVRVGGTCGSAAGSAKPHKRARAPIRVPDIPLKNGGKLVQMSLEEVLACVGRPVEVYARWVVPRFTDYWTALVLGKVDDGEEDRECDDMDVEFECMWIDPSDSREKDSGTTFTSPVRYIRRYEGEAIVDPRVGSERVAAAIATHKRARVIVDSGPVGRGAQAGACPAGSGGSARGNGGAGGAVRAAGATVAAAIAADDDDESEDDDADGGIGSLKQRAAMYSTAGKLLQQLLPRKTRGRPARKESLKAQFLRVAVSQGARKGADDALCICGVTVKSGWISGSNLTLHYSKCKTLRERMAGTEYARQYATKHGESATAPPPVDGKQAQLVVIKSPRVKLDGSRLKHIVVLMVCSGKVSFRFFEDSHSKELWLALNAGVSVSRASVAEYIMMAAAELYHYLQLRVKEAMELGKVCLSTDGWASRGAKEFEGTAIHFADRSFKLVTALVDFARIPSATRTAETKQKYFKNLLAKYNGLSAKEERGSVSCFSMDGASVNRKTANLLRARFHWCCAHRLQLAVRDSTKLSVTDADGFRDGGDWPMDHPGDADLKVIPDIIQVLAKAQALTNAVRCSAVATYDLSSATMAALADEELSAAAVGGSPSGSLPESNATRWSSTWRQADALLRHKGALTLLDGHASSPAFAKLKLERADWETLKDLTEAQRVTKVLTDRLQTQNETTTLVSSFIFLIKEGIAILEHAGGKGRAVVDPSLPVPNLKTETGRRYALVLSRCIAKRFEPELMGENELINTAIMLDPRFNPSSGILFASEVWTKMGKHARQRVEKEATAVLTHLREPEVDGVSGGNPMLGNADSGDEAGHRQSYEELCKQAARKETVRMFSLFKDHPTMEPLEFWRTYGEQLPVLARVAREVHGLQVTTVWLETCFSLCKNIETDDRTRLSEPMFKALVMLRANWKLLPAQFTLDWEKLGQQGINRDTIANMQQQVADYEAASAPGSGGGAASSAPAPFKGVDGDM